MEKIRTNSKIVIFIIALVFAPLFYALIASVSNIKEPMFVTVLFTVIVFLIAEVADGSDSSGWFIYKDGMIYKDGKNVLYFKWDDMKIINLKKKTFLNQFDFSTNEEPLKNSINTLNCKSFLFLVKKHAPIESEIYKLAEDYAKELKKRF